MRAIIVTVVIAAAAIAGFALYRGGSSAPQQGASTTTLASASALHTDCTVANAVYQYNEDQRLRLSFRRAPAAANAGPNFSNGAGGRQIGNMMFVVTVTSFNKQYAFAPINAMASGPAYASYVLQVRPQTGGGAAMPVQLFDSEMHIISDMPRDDSEAPRYIIMPDLMRRLYADHIDLPTGAFRFFRCERPAAQPAAAP